ncbi:VCBS domain-containing protein, partial [Enterococcus faecalis]|uniref:VCBS domain-containing protein n=1 Tax=Enterococcus faecalis TaxID=1351 RepID=UPI0021B0E249
GNVLDNDTDVDHGATLSVVAVNGLSNVGNAVAGPYGSITVAANGAWTYTLDDSDPDTNELASGETVTDVFNYTISDE